MPPLPSTTSSRPPERSTGVVYPQRTEPQYPAGRRNRARLRLPPLPWSRRGGWQQANLGGIWAGECWSKVGQSDAKAAAGKWREVERCTRQSHCPQDFRILHVDKALIKIFKMKIWKETNAVTRAIFLETQKKMQPVIETKTLSKWAMPLHKSKFVKYTRAECNSNLNDFTYLSLQCLCTIVVWYQQQQTKPSCTSCMFKSNQ